MAPAVAPARRRRAVTLAALLLVTLLLGACSALRWTYDQGPTLVAWWLGRYVDFDEAQAPRVRQALDEAFAWHRREALAEDVALLDRAAAEAAAPELDAARACAWWTTFGERRDRTLAVLAPAIAELAPTLTPAQWRQVQRRFDTLNTEWAEENLQADPREREKAAFERTLDRVESLYGRLDGVQRAFLAERLRRSSWDPAVWQQKRLADQRDTLATLQGLAALPDAAARTARVRDWLRRLPTASAATPPGWREGLLREQCQLAADLHARATPVQRRHAADKLRGWADDLRVRIPAARNGAASGNGAP